MLAIKAPGGKIFHYFWAAIGIRANTGVESLKQLVAFLKFKLSTSDPSTYSVMTNIFLLLQKAFRNTSTASLQIFTDNSVAVVS